MQANEALAKYQRQKWEEAAMKTTFSLEDLGIVIGNVRSSEDLAKNIITFLARLIGLFAVLSIMAGGTMMIVSTNNESLQTKGKNLIIYSVVAVVAVLGAYVVVSNVQQVLYSLGRYA